MRFLSCKNCHFFGHEFTLDLEKTCDLNHENGFQNIITPSLIILQQWFEYHLKSNFIYVTKLYSFYRLDNQLIYN